MTDRGRTNLIEELGRVEAESPNTNRRDEVSRIHSELNQGYKKGGRVKSRGKAKRGFGKEVRQLRMPFKSEKQRKYLWKNHPKIAKKWATKYGSKTTKKKKK